MKKCILIAGAGGYIGSKMVEFFLKKEFTLIALDRFFFGDVLDDLRDNKNLKIIKDDIRFCDKNIFKGVDTVIALASLSNDPSADLKPEITKAINHLGALSLAEIAKEMGCKKYIFASSCSIYGSGKGILTEKSPIAPISEYGKSKAAAEEDIFKLADNNFCVTSLRSGTVYGLSKRRMRFDLIINLMTLHAWRNKKIYIMGVGKQWRPLIHIDDLIKAYQLVANESNIKKINKKIFNAGSNEQNYQVFQIANMFKKYFSDLAIEETPDDPDQRSYHVNFNALHNILDFKATKTVDDGIIEIKEALEKGEIVDSLTTYTVKYYRHLLEMDKILSTIKINNRLF